MMGALAEASASNLGEVARTQLIEPSLHCCRNLSPVKQYVARGQREKQRRYPARI